jgi:hypothetical protein
VPTTLEFTDAVAAATDHIFEMVKGSIPRFEWEMHASLIAGINRLEKDENR